MHKIQQIRHRSAAHAFRRGAVLRGAVASLAVLAGAGLLVYGATSHKREVTIQEESTTVIPPKPPPAFLIEDALRRGLPPPPPEPARIEKHPAERVWDPEWRLVRNVTVGALHLKADGLHRLALPDGPALCPT